MTQDNGAFEVLEIAEVRKLTRTARSKEVDTVWRDRIATLALGKGFRTQRPETETIRQFKKRMNAAAAAAHRTLEWTTMDKNLPEDVEATNYVATVKAIEVVKEEPAETASGEATDNGTEKEQEGSTETTPTAQGRGRRG